MKSILVTSGYGGNTHEPFVQMEAEILDRPLQLAPAEARSLAINLLQAAEAAESDACIVRFVTKELGQPITTAAGILAEFRKYRKPLDG